MVKHFLLTLLPIPTLFLLAASAVDAAASDAVLRFDFGGEASPVEAGWLPVSEKTVYGKDRGHGWRTTEGLAGVDRTEGYPVTRDFVSGATKEGPARHTFSIDLPKGRYAVAVVAGDRSAAVSPFRIMAQGTAVAPRVGTGAPGGWDVQRFTVDVAGGTLDLTLEAEQAWVVSALVVAPLDRVAEAQAIVENVEDCFAKGSPEWVADLREHQPEEPQGTLAASDERKGRGYEVFTGPVVRRVFPTTVPDESDVVRQLRLMAAPGQYEAASLAVRAFQPLRGVRIAVSDLAGAGGSIPSGQVDVKLVRCWPQREDRWQTRDYVQAEYMVVPEMIEPQDRHGEIWIGPNATRQFWLTVHVPDGTKPGTYRGRATVSAADRPAVELALEVEILPFPLRQPKPMALGMYYSTAPKVPDSLVLAELRNMRQHGMNSLAFDLRSRGKPKRPEGAAWDLEYLHWMMGLLRQAGGFEGPFPVHMSIGGPEITDEVRQLVHEMVQAVEAARAKSGWPEILYYPVDEPFGGPKLDRAAALYRAFKEVPKIRTYCTVSAESVRRMGEWLDVRCHALSAAQEFAWPEAWKGAVDKGAEFWWYSNATRHYLDVIRFKAGFFHWKTRATGQFYWHFCNPSASPFCDFDGKHRDFIAVYPGLDGPVDSTLWECLREGLDDARYAWTLESLLEESAKKLAAASAVARGREVLDQLRDKVETDMKFYDRKHAPRTTAFHYICEWKPEEFQEQRERLARAIQELLGCQ